MEDPRNEEQVKGNPSLCGDVPHDSSHTSVDATTAAATTRSEVMIILASRRSLEGEQPQGRRRTPSERK
jgi:hypothetical protein